MTWKQQKDASMLAGTRSKDLTSLRTRQRWLTESDIELFISQPVFHWFTPSSKAAPPTNPKTEPPTRQRVVKWLRQRAHTSFKLKQSLSCLNIIGVSFKILIAVHHSCCEIMTPLAVPCQNVAFHSPSSYVPTLTLFSALLRNDLWAIEGMIKMPYLQLITQLSLYSESWADVNLYLYIHYKLRFPPWILKDQKSKKTKTTERHECEKVLVTAVGGTLERMGCYGNQNELYAYKKIYNIKFNKSKNL